MSGTWEGDVFSAMTRDRRIGPRGLPSVLDWTLALALLAIALLEIAGGSMPGPAALGSAVQAVSLLAVAFRRVAPLAAIAISAAAYLPHAVAFGASGSLAQLLAGLVLFHAVGRHTDLRGVLAGAAIGFLLIVVQGLSGALASFLDWTFALALSSAALGIGIAQRVQAVRAKLLADAAELASRRQVAVAEASVREERARIARELHDVVAHNVGLIALQAGGARTVLATRPERAGEALARIEDTARQTLVEMRHLVGILREADADRSPIPRLDQLPALVQEARTTGQLVEMTVEGTAVELPAGVELAAFRIVQEALTNARRHAPGAEVRIRLAYTPDRVRVSIVNDAPADGDRAAGEGSGHGLIGMRERVRVYGGSLEAGPTPDHGFRVEASLPLERPAG